MSNIEILETPHREYDSDRDWLVPETGLRKRSAEVVTFTPKFLRCSICGMDSHRAHACPKRPRVKSPSTTG
jgi:hypothetical protein